MTALRQPLFRSFCFSLCFAAAVFAAAAFATVRAAAEEPAVIKVIVTESFPAESLLAVITPLLPVKAVLADGINGIVVSAPEPAVQEITRLAEQLDQIAAKRKEASEKAAAKNLAGNNIIADLNAAPKATRTATHTYKFPLPAEIDPEKFRRFVGSAFGAEGKAERDEKNRLMFIIAGSREMCRVLQVFVEKALLDAENLAEYATPQFAPPPPASIPGKPQENMPENKTE